MQAEDIQGTIDINEEGTLFDAALDEFLQVRLHLPVLVP
jgi:hypothetical protein